MMEYRNVIVLQDARAVRDNFVQELAKWNFAVRSCGSLQGFRHLYALHPSPLIVLTGEPAGLVRYAEDARAAAPRATIVALCTDADPNWRVRIMASGADACHPASIQVIELAAILSSWARHASRADDAVQSALQSSAQSAAQSAYGDTPSQAAARSVFRDGKPARVEFHGESAAEPAEIRTVHKGNGRGPDPGRAGMANFIHRQSHRQSVTSFQSYGAGHRGHPHLPGRRDFSFDETCSKDRRHPSQSGNSINPGGPSKSDNSECAADCLARSAAAGHPDRNSRHDLVRSGRDDAGWRLDVNCRVLICPVGRTLLLTGAENGFLVRIAASNGQLLRRRVATATGTSAGMLAHDGDSGGLDIRGMDVLVSRLRRKARLEGMELPLLSVRGCGYLFAEYLRVAPSGPVRSFGKLQAHPQPSVRVSAQADLQRAGQVSGSPAVPSSDPSTSEVPGVPAKVLAAVPA
jgi:DNA-binding response OmpR family regulator